MKKAIGWIMSSLVATPLLFVALLFVWCLMGFWWAANAITRRRRTPPNIY